MAAKSTGDTATLLRRAAEAHPDVEQGIACAGTVLESRTYKVGGKAFLFLGPKSARLKLIESAKEMASLAKKEAGRFSIGAQGWAAIIYNGKSPPRADLERWVDESYRALAGKPAPKSPSPKSANPKNANRRTQKR